HVETNPLNDEAGNIVGVIACVSDTAERRQVEDALHSKERQLTSIYENVTEVLYFLSVEPDDRFRFLTVNQSFFDATGLSANQVIGKYVHEVIPEPSLTIVLEHYDQAIRENKTVRWEEVTEYPSGTKYGEVIVTPIYDASGICTNLIGSVHDLTERRRVEEDLRRYREHLEELVSERTAELEAKNAQLAEEIAEREHAQDESQRQAQFPEENPNPVLRISTGGTILYANPIGQNLLHAWECTIGDNLPDLWFDILTWVRDENKSISVEISVEDQTYEFEVVPVQGMEYINLYGKEITERKRAEALSTQYLMEVERSNKELDQFATAASHDLQAPLRTVVGFLQLLKRRAKGQLEPKLSEFIDRAINAGINMQEMVGGLLTFSRIKVDEENLTVVDCDEVLASAIDDQQVAIAEFSASITHDPLPTVRGVKSLLTQVFQNLISNALKFHGTDTPVVHVAVAESENDWLFSVQDNGIGFDQQYAESIFSLFRRLHTQEEYPGNGIGLSLCKKIIERHGGTIWAESEIGKGSTFYFTLPKLTA
ncbi:MAG TPA: ATP-binding protein, partial [Candidatus Lokiarchaeia archaeon]|nr:ATP-binding protein [Candidatus Lokiarchaeia archaeon]